jgi:drug/metabolite transporter (DMT)-like permease
LRSPRFATAYLLLTLTALFWSSNFVLGRAVRADMPPIALAFWRWVVALLILLPLVWRQLPRALEDVRGHWPALCALGILGVGNFNTFVYLGLQQTSATSAVLLISTGPVVILVLSVLMLGTRVGWRGILGVLVSLIGVATIVSAGDLAALFQQVGRNRGDLWILAAVFSWALYSVLLRWRPPRLDPVMFLCLSIATGMLLLVPLELWDLARGSRFELSGSNLASIAYVAVFPSVLAFIFWNRAVAEVGANRAGLFLYLMPAFGALLAALLLGERLYGYHLLGIAFIATGIWTATRDRTAH